VKTQEWMLLSFFDNMINMFFESFSLVVFSVNKLEVVGGLFCNLKGFFAGGFKCMYVYVQKR